MIKLKKTNFCCLRVKKVSLLVTASLLMVGPFTTANSKVIEPSLGTYSWSAQELEKISGKVVSESGQPISGATVNIRGTTKSAKTGSSGVFELEIPSREVTLVVSHLGYETKQVKVSNLTDMVIELDPVDDVIDEVVVVAYGQQDKRTSTHAIESVEMNAIQDVPVGSLSQSLKYGNISGLNVSGGESRPGQDASISIREPRILSKDGGTLEPIYVIDDVVKSSFEFNLLDQSEIESISILKDAAAAIYGVNGNQGAVLVKTKRGRSGEYKFTYSGSVGISDAIRLPDMMSGYDHARYLNTYNQTDGKPENDPSFYADDELDHFRDNNYDWLSMAWKSAMNTRQTLNASGGTEKVTYFGSVSYNNQDGNLENISKDRWTYRSNVSLNVGNNLKFDFQLSGDLSKNKQFWLKQGGENIDKDVVSLMQTPQFNPPYVDGLPVLLTSATNSNAENFHFFEVLNSGDYTQDNSAGLNVNLNATYDVPFVEGLTVRGFFNRRSTNSFGKQFGTTYDVYRFSMLGSNNHIFGGDVVNSITLKNGDMLRFNPIYSNNYQLNAQINYERNFGKHYLSLLGVYEQRESYSNGVATYIEKFINGGEDNMVYFSGPTALQSESESEQGYLSYIGRLVYNYDEKYLFETTFRADGSTNFAPENRWGYFPSFSAGWVLSKEDFFQEALSFFDFFKIRGAIGFSGADRTRPFQWYTRYRKQTQRGGVFGGNGNRGIVFNQNGIANRDVKWDKTIKKNIGVDMSMLDSRLSVSAEVYHDENVDMLTQLSTSISLLVGESLPSENFSRVNTFGTELSAHWRDRISDDWSYSVRANFNWSDDKNILRDVAESSVGTMLDPTGKSSDRGVYGYIYKGFFRTQEQVDAFLAENPDYTIFGKKPEPGMLYYEDISGARTGGDLTEPDGKIDENDRTYITSKENNHYGIGLNLQTTYKSFSFQMSGGLSWGGQSFVEGDARKRASATSNRPAFWADHWSEDNPNAAYPNPYYADQNDLISSFWFRSSTTARISSIQLSYNLPEAFNRKVGVENIRTYVVVTQPFNLYNPFDYRYNSGTYATYPTIRTMSLGLSVGF